MTRTVLLAAALTGCGIPAIPLDLRVTSGVDLPPAGEDTVLSLFMVTADGSHAQEWATDASCLWNMGVCELDADASMMGCRSPALCTRRLEGTLWVDLDGDDDVSQYRALVDGDPIAFFGVEIGDLPLDEPIDIELLWPEEALDEG